MSDGTITGQGAKNTMKMTTKQPIYCSYCRRELIPITKEYKAHVDRYDPITGDACPSWSHEFLECPAIAEIDKRSDEIYEYNSSIRFWEFWKHPIRDTQYWTKDLHAKWSVMEYPAGETTYCRW